ncbi:MAG: hypothetical protein COV66_15230 [Nitrospinae bacterium CG11_big_fil_rev_8_21_14_0_20_45_15]|nr:MAG: hypothetical protein COV66_15230 [Nitrospinae bacterium CG11_big_fil_rev_8_21_14_0_20_45_15]
MTQKKKSGSKKQSSTIKNSSGKKSALKKPALGASALFLAGGLLWAFQSSRKRTPVAPATGNLIETRPILSPAIFTGKVSQAYSIAQEIPKVLDSQFCYCYCKKEHNHKNLLTCYTSKHGAKCSICLNEVFYSYELYNQGKTLDEIVTRIDDKFYRPYQPRRI